jgi:hypothetical protein
MNGIRILTAPSIGRFRVEWGMPKVRGAGCVALPKVRDTTRIPQISTRILGIYPAA